jgi:hypothetical protein
MLDELQLQAQMDLINQYQALQDPAYRAKQKSLYEEKAGDINAAQAFANIGDIIAGQKVGSTAPYFQNVQSELKKDILTGEDTQRKNILDAYLKSKYAENLGTSLQNKKEAQDLSQKNKEAELALKGKQVGIQEKALGLKGQTLEMKSAQNKVNFANLPKEDQIMINKLSDQKAKSAIVNNLMDPLMQQMNDPKISEEQKAVSALEQLKLMNSQLGPDALGAGETERVSKWLQTAPDPIVGKWKVGPDIEKFSEQLKNALNRNKKSIQTIDQQINQYYGRTPKNLNVPLDQKSIVKKLVNPKTGQTKIIYSDGSEEVKDGK